ALQLRARRAGARARPRPPGGGEEVDLVANPVLSVYEPAANGPGELVQLELEPRRDAEVAASSAEAPQQLGVLIHVRSDNRPVDGDKLGSDDVVAGETELGRQVSDAAAHRKPTHARRGHHSAGGDEPVSKRGAVAVEPRRAAARTSGHRGRVYLDAAQRRDVDHEAVVEHAVSGGVVTPAPDGDVELTASRKVERGNDIAGPRTAHDHRWPAIDE